MYKNAKPLFLICETPLHVGSGSDLGIVDLPIQRERHTNFPKIESSSLKGALREAFESAFNSKAFTNIDDNDVKIHRTFGYDDGSLTKGQKDNLLEHFENGATTQFSGALSLTDARLLLFPVKSLYGVFAWVTCPRIIQKFEEELKLCGINQHFGIVAGSKICVNNKTIAKNKTEVYLEEFKFNLTEDSKVDTLGQWLSQKLYNGDGYLGDKLMTDIIVLEDNDFRDFVTLTTEVITRTKIDNNTGTVQTGALFSEEYLPAESIMYSLAMFTDEFTKNLTKLKAKKANKDDNNEPDGVTEFFDLGLETNGNIVQIGANATLGKGIVKTKFVKEETK